MSNNTQKNQDEGFKVLICGSQRFDDQSFVFGMLDALYGACDVGTIVTSRFSGSCEYARQWTEIMYSRGKHIYCQDFDFDDELGQRNISLFEQENIPDFVLSNDPFFQKGKNKLLELKPDVVLAFPNPENELGAATLNIRRFANLAGLGNNFLNCAEALELVTSFRQSQSNLLVPEESAVRAKNSLTNRHPGKRI